VTKVLQLKNEASIALTFFDDCRSIAPKRWLIKG